MGPALHGGATITHVVGASHAAIESSVQGANGVARPSCKIVVNGGSKTSPWRSDEPHGSPLDGVVGRATVSTHCRRRDHLPGSVRTTVCSGAASARGVIRNPQSGLRITSPPSWTLPFRSEPVHLTRP